MCDGCSLAFVGGRLLFTMSSSAAPVLMSVLPSLSTPACGWSAADVHVLLGNCDAFLRRTVLSLAFAHCLTLEEMVLMEQEQRARLCLQTEDSFVLLWFCSILSAVLHGTNVPDDFRPLRNHTIFQRTTTAVDPPPISRLRRHREERERTRQTRLRGESRCTGGGSTRLVRGAEFAHLVYTLNSCCRDLLHSLANYLSAASLPSYDLDGTFLVSGAVAKICDGDASPSAVLLAHEAMARSLAFRCCHRWHNSGIGRRRGRG